MTWSDFDKGVQLALDYDCASVCIMPYALKFCAEKLAGSTVKASTTIGFPHGGHTTEIKVAEAKKDLHNRLSRTGHGLLRQRSPRGNWGYVKADIQAVTEAAHEAGQKIKVIFENASSNDDQKIRLCEICGELNVDWVKTSTGYAPSGATMEDLALMRKHSPAHVQVKAAGGVRDLDTLLKARGELGITRCGLSRTADILDELKRRLAGEAPRASTVPGDVAY